MNSRRPNSIFSRNQKRLNTRGCLLAKATIVCICSSLLWTRRKAFSIIPARYSNSPSIPHQCVRCVLVATESSIRQHQNPPADSGSPLGVRPHSKFGSNNPLPFFNLLQQRSVLPPTKFGISSVPVSLPYSIKISRWLSSTYQPASPHTTRLIIAGCACEIVFWKLFIAES
jgi:hypothetical protein